MFPKNARCTVSAAVACGLTLAAAGTAWSANEDSAARLSTTTPIKHVVVIFQENISFDHYFGTYPYATNPVAETPFHAKDDTPRVNNLLSGGLLTSNPNSTQPFRMDPTMSVTCDQSHNYTPEQSAFDHGLMDKFPENTGTGSTTSSPCVDYGKSTGVVMGYFDGNT